MMTDKFSNIVRDIEKMANLKLAASSEKQITNREAPQSYAKSLIGGIDPTGLITFNTAMNEPYTARRGWHRALGTLGGFVGGATLIPAIVGGASNLFLNRGRFKGLSGALKAFGSGAVSPFTSAYGGYKTLKTLDPKRKLNTDFVSELLGNLSDAGYVKPVMRDAINKAALPFKTIGIPGHNPTVVDLTQHFPVFGDIRDVIASNTYNTIGAIGTSGALGGMAAYGQYSSGTEAGDRIRQLKHNIIRGKSNGLKGQTN